ncbi:MAG: branched chain amino acid aminotransferase, partial [Clostridiales bacterium]|nr:branched chain amino acid aminotransferase [Clostridiales bacterium]
MEIRIEKTMQPKTKVLDCELGFGKVFTDHMFVMDYHAGEGWVDPRIVPYAPLQLMPASTCLHYALEVFEGMKAYRQLNGSVALFRPQLNFERLNSSC